MADNTKQTIIELRELVVTYAKQETVEPLRGLGKYAGLSILGALLMGFGAIFVAVGALRLLQEETVMGHSDHFSWTWAPYLIVFAGSIVVAAVVWKVGSKVKQRRSARSAA